MGQCLTMPPSEVEVDVIKPIHDADMVTLKVKKSCGAYGTWKLCPMDDNLANEGERPRSQSIPSSLALSEFPLGKMMTSVKRLLPLIARGAKI